MTLEIENYDEQTPGGSTIAIFDVYVPETQVRYRRLKLIKGKKGCFAVFPSYAISQADGSKTYHPYVEYSRERQAKFLGMVLDALRPFMPSGF